ncbi:prepilin peptidase [uncultured Jatrophihabitans sp.]|uniref:prepilin peptidase n=1 Tax=uncultured Jatrophihabitans sp. TaxID=1610747 RepID=UPI0035CB5DB7
MSATAVGAVVGAVVCALPGPYLARLTHSVPDREMRDWWRGRPASTTRTAVTAVLGAVLGALGGAAAGWSALLPAFLALSLLATPLVVIDYTDHRLPNRLVYPLAAAGAVLLVLAALVRGDWHNLLRAVEGGAAVYAVLFVFQLLAPRSFGSGDVRLGGVLGGYLGWFGWGYVYYGIFAGFLLGAVVAVALLMTRRASMKSAIPFGPMMIIGALVVLAFRLVPSTAF